jgi:asparagine synthase (glutamine-hydrolysing)
MFAFCLVDVDARRMLFARDRLGIKPLYVWETPRMLAATSEVKSLLEHPDFAARLDADHLDEHLAFRSCAADRHLLAGVRQVEPGEWLEVREGGETRRTRWWRPPMGQTWSGSFAAATDALEAAIDRSVKSQLVSDVPVGCQFSAGVDSSIVSAFADRHTTTHGQYQTFSIVVDDPGYSEEKWIDQASKHLGIPGHRFHFGEAEFAERLERATWHLDQPIDHMNSIGIMLLAERSKPFVTVLLSGEGADEAFCGYPRFFRVLLRSALGPIAPVLARVPRVGAKLAMFGEARGADDRDWFIRASSPILPSHLAELTGRDTYGAALEVRRAMFPRDGELLARCRRYELETFLVGLLKRQDKMTMAHSLENRVPLLDHELVELALSMPSSYFADRRPRLHPLEHNTKRVLKAVAERHFPRRFVYRKKEAFGMPLGKYFRSPALAPLFEDLLRSTERRGLFDARTVRRWWTERLDEPYVTEALWVAIAFELWARKFLDRAPSLRMVA